MVAERLECTWPMLVNKECHFVRVGDVAFKVSSVEAKLQLWVTRRGRDGWSWQLHALLLIDRSVTPHSLPFTKETKTLSNEDVERTYTWMSVQWICYYTRLCPSRRLRHVYTLPDNCSMPLRYIAIKVSCLDGRLSLLWLTWCFTGPSAVLMPSTDRFKRCRQSLLLQELRRLPKTIRLKFYESLR